MISWHVASGGASRIMWSSTPIWTSSRRWWRGLPANRIANRLCDLGGRCGEVLRRDAAQVTRISRIVVGASAMQRATVVPDHQVADPPGVAMDELALRRVLHEVAQQEPALRHRPADDVRRMRSHVERLAPRSRMNANQRMRHRRQRRALGIGVVSESELAARMEDRMLGSE